jgi:Mor family transcriptional regulator
MHQHNPSTTPSVASTSTPSSGHKLDPIAVLREELAAAAICHGVERVDDLTEELVRRYVQRLGGAQIYVPSARSLEKTKMAAEIRERFTGRNARELAKVYGLTPRHIRRLLMAE